MQAASLGNEALVRFMVTTFGSKLCHVRDDSTNLLNLCCLNGISDSTCILVAETFPNLVNNETGGILNPNPPTFAFVKAQRRIPAFFMTNRNTLHDGAAPLPCLMFYPQLTFHRYIGQKHCQRCGI